MEVFEVFDLILDFFKFILSLEFAFCLLVVCFQIPDLIYSVTDNIKAEIELKKKKLKKRRYKKWTNNMN